MFLELLELYYRTNNRGQLHCQGTFTESSIQVLPLSSL